MGDVVQRARELAYRAHAGQVDKAGRPYIEHVARVAAACADDPEAEVVAWAHDISEDCDELFHAEMVDLLPIRALNAAVTLDRGMWRNSGVYYAAIRRNPLALRVKLADIADNVDESRLALLDEKTAARLRRKYAKAREALTGGKS